MTRFTLWRPFAAVLLVIAAVLTLRGSAPAAALQESTPTAPYSCDGATPTAATPSAAMAGMGTPTAGSDQQEMEFDQLYIDMMLPHHASIIALSQAALPRLQDERLKEIARNIIDKQAAEREELMGYRDDFYGSPEPAKMDATRMDTMSRAMPGMGSMEEMAFEMDADAQVAAFCAAADPDLAFIDMTIAHHTMAITASEAAVDQATHPELVAFAERVIADQQREIDALTAIRADLTGEATPAS